VVYYWKHTGDPLTPGQPAKAGVPRLERAEAETLPRIVVATVTANDAQALLAEPGVEVEVTVELDDQTRPIRNVIARLPGSGPELVLLGTHYDAWVLGATDPHSGTAVLIEIARGLAALTKAGWRPRRSIVLAFWDAEEPGVLGSTEWVEEHLAELRANAVAYLNVDAIKAATVNVLGSHQYRDLVASVLATVVDPRGGKPLADGWRTRQEEAWTKKHEQPGAARRPPFEPQLGDIGIGADWTAFFYHAGVPTLQWQTAGAGPGVYQVWHSSRDSYDYYRTSTDPGFEFTPIFARAMGVTALRLADAESPPQDWGVAARRIDAWTEDLAPRAATAGLALDAAAIRRGTARLAAAAAARQTRPCAPGPTPRVEQAFLVDGGIARRPWFRHLLVAGNADNGYASLPLPELAEAIQGRSQPELDAAVARLTAALDRAAALLDPDAAATPALDAPIAAVGVPGTAAPAASAETLGEDVKAVMKAIRACRAGDLDEHLVFPLRWRVDGGDGFTRRDYRDAKSLAKDRCSLAGQMTCRARLAESADKATCTDEWSNDLTHSTTKYVFTFTPVGSHWRLTAVDETLWGD
jgi:N-acetylated-alpha-linked acidic dipeptidase